MAHVAHINTDALRYFAVDVDCLGDLGSCPQTIETGIGTQSISGQVGVAVDGTDAVHIAYFDETSSELRYVRIGDAPQTLAPCEDGRPAIAIGPSDEVHVAYAHKSRLRHIQVVGAGGPQVLVTGIGSPPFGFTVGFDFDDNGIAHVAFYEQIGWSLQYLRGPFVEEVPSQCDIIPFVGCSDQVR